MYACVCFKRRGLGWHAVCVRHLGAPRVTDVGCEATRACWSWLQRASASMCRHSGTPAPRPGLPRSVPHILSDESSGYYQGYVLAGGAREAGRQRHAGGRTSLPACPWQGSLSTRLSGRAMLP